MVGSINSACAVLKFGEDKSGLMNYNTGNRIELLNPCCVVPLRYSLRTGYFNNGKVAIIMVI